MKGNENPRDTQKAGNYMRTWKDIRNINDQVEKLIFPVELDDDFDRGHVNEYKS